MAAFDYRYHDVWNNGLLFWSSCCIDTNDSRILPHLAAGVYVRPVVFPSRFCYRPATFCASVRDVGEESYHQSDAAFVCHLHHRMCAGTQYTDFAGVSIHWGLARCTHRFVLVFISVYMCAIPFSYECCRLSHGYVAPQSKGSSIGVIHSSKLSRVRDRSNLWRPYHRICILGMVKRLIIPLPKRTS